MELGIIIAIVGSAVAIVGTVLTLFLWVRGEANSDRKDLSNDIKELRIDLITVMRGISDEMKDFHGRLEKQDAEFRMRFLAIEERRK